MKSYWFTPPSRSFAQDVTGKIFAHSMGLAGLDFLSCQRQTDCDDTAARKPLVQGNAVGLSIVGALLCNVETTDASEMT